MLGDRLYYGLTTGVITKKIIRAAYLAKYDKPGEALEMYLSLREMVKGVKIPRRI